LPLPAPTTDAHQTAMTTELSDSDNRGATLKLFSSSPDSEGTAPDETSSESETHPPQMELPATSAGQTDPENEQLGPAQVEPTADLTTEAPAPVLDDEPAQHVSLSSIAEWEATPSEDPAPVPTGIVSAPQPRSVTRGIPVSSHNFPMAILTPEAVLSPLEQRVRRLEEAVAQLQNKPQPDTRIMEPAPPHAPATPLPPAATEPGTADRTRTKWWLFDIVAEARVILRMIVDPRYRMTWIGRLVPAVLMIAFLSAYYVIAAVPILGPLLVNIPVVGSLVVKIVELLIAFVLFRVLSQEARRYRQMTPDLPPSMRG
jgi:hypothetical protein